MTAPAEDPRGGEAEVSECTAACKPVPDGPANGHWHDLDNGQKWVWAMFAPRPPAAGRGDTDSGGEVEVPECEHHSWAGLMALLDEHWPADIFPTREDDITRAAGARIVSLIRWVDRLRAARPAGDRAQPTQELREALELVEQAVDAWWRSGSRGLDGLRSAVADTIAPLLDAQAAVSRVRKLRHVWTRDGSEVVPSANLRRALDGP